MITLITGAPGAGKSAALVSLLSELGKDRALFVFNIPDLKLPHVPLEDPHSWPDSVPDGSIVVIDEVQDVWRPAGPGQRIPPDIAKLETHRHRGLDFFIVTQGPNLVHSNVRALVGRHVHLRDVGFLGRWWYEWPECCDNVRTAWKNAPIKKRYKLPKHIFGQYKSASLHVKPVRSFPFMLLVAVVCVIASLGLAAYATHSVSSRFEDSDVPKPSSVNPSDSGSGNGASSASSSAAPLVPAVTYDYTSFVPRVPYQPESAPAYDEVRKVSTMPRVAGAVCGPSGCKCYTQQGTDSGMSSAHCRAWFDSPPFDPYQLPQAEKPVLASPPPADKVAQTPGTLSLRF